MASNEAQRLVIKIAADTSEFEASLNKLKSTASNIVAPPGGGQGKGKGKSPAAGDAEALATSLNQTALNLADVRAQSKAVGMDIYRNIGNPFLVVSSLSQRITGIYQLQRDVEKAGAATEQLARQLAQARRAGDSVQIQNLNTQLDAAIKKQGDLNNRLGSFGTRMRGFADFFVNQLLTAGLFGFFMLNTMLIQGLVTAGVEIGRRLVDPMGVLVDRAKEVAGLVDKLGGIEKLSIAFDLSPEDRKAIEALVELNRSREAAGNRTMIEQAMTDAMGFAPGRVSEDQIKQRRLEEGIRAMYPGGTGLNPIAELQKFLMRGAGYDLTSLLRSVRGEGDPFARGAASLDVGEVQQQQRRDYAREITLAMREGKTVTEEQLALVRELYGLDGDRLASAYKLIQAHNARQAQAQREVDQLERDRYRLTGNASGLGTGEGAGADKWFMREVAASRKIEQLQRALNAFGAQITRRQQAQQLGQSRADVIRAGIGAPGQSGFELAAAVLEARERARETREQIQIQRRQEGIQKRIEYYNSVQANAKRQQDILANAMALGLSEAKLALTVDPKSGQLIARFVAGDVYNMMAGAAANNTPVTGGGGRGTGKIPT